MLNAMVIVKLVIGNYEETCEDYSFWGYFRGVFPLRKECEQCKGRGSLFGCCVG